MMRVSVINGPNLDLLGTREPDIYGPTTLGELESMVAAWAGELDMTTHAVHSNHEGELIEAIHRAAGADGIVINPAAYTHTSRAIADAIASVGVPTVEVHISNVKAREPWRAHSVISPVCVRTIYGRGVRGYRDALRHLSSRAVSPFETVRYGPHPENVGDLRVPASASGLVMLAHGGFLLRQWERDTIESIAVDLTSRGLATWNIEYRRLGVGGGWPGSAHDVKMAMEFAHQLPEVGHLPLAVVGHSAGGFLALWSGVRPTKSQPVAVIGLASITELRSVIEAGAVGSEVAIELLDSGAPGNLDEMPPHTTLIHGGQDDVVPPSHSTRLSAGASVEIFDGLGHFDLLDPAKEHWPSVVTAINNGVRSA